ncbi:DUF1275 domain-containing protein [Kitasatospora sp. NBC_00240]|uniref:YoaK family protein n=1 Tax=Kitasatospora sp. NBC_00240 TaxID=2903567 RepID=UPI002256D2B7|nr:YoaK family protein [Kitasatospora sp. NBC_00240]MCX5210360.1 DUF1275 domain-containing protein [Kitasatospora sp. NBC_00240]
MTLRRSAALDAVLIVLTLTTGVIEAVSLLALGHVFTALMTGNMLFLAFGLAGGPGLSVTASAVSLGAFAVGNLAGALLETRVEARRHRWFVAGLVAEALLLGGAGLAAGGIGRLDEPLTGHLYLVIALTALAMGLRSVTTLRARVAELPTTLTTRALTSVISGLAPVVGRDPARNGDAGSALLRAAGVVAMFLGGLLGAWMLTAGHRPQLPLLVSAAVVLLCAVGFGVAGRRRPPAKPRLG